MSILYCALIEIEPANGCELDPGKIAGAAVRCYIPARSPNLAIQLLESQLKFLKMKLIETEWCVDYDNTDWENKDSGVEEGLVAEARSTGRIMFDSFHVWGHEPQE